MLWCVCTHVFWMPRTAGPYLRGANMNMCPYMCTYACTALGTPCQALLSVSCKMEPTLCITSGPVPGEGRRPKLLDAKGLLPAGCLQPGLTTKPIGPHPGTPIEKQGLPTATPHDTRHRRPLLTPPTATHLTPATQQPGLDQRDDTTPGKARALPALCRHQELDHRDPQAMGECNYPCPADGEDDLAAQAAQEPDLLAPSSFPSKPSGSSLARCPWQPQAKRLRTQTRMILWAAGD